MRTPIVAVTAVSLLLLAGCALLEPPAPRTTHASDDGGSETVDWEDYPANAGFPVETALASPAQGETEERTERMQADLHSALVERDLIPADARWEARGEEGWYPYGGNGYGGESMLVTYNSASLGIAADIAPQDWGAVLDVARDVLAGFGLAEDPIGGVDETWGRSVTMSAHGEAVDVVVQDLRRDAEELALAEQNDHLVRGVSLFVVNTTVDAEREAEFLAAAEPFEGLPLPEPTASD